VGTTALATFKIKAWDETAFDDLEDAGKITRARVRKSFKGDIDGVSTLEYLMTYTADGSASFVGMERVSGRLGNRSGSFVLQHVGNFKDGVAKALLLVVPGSATGELNGLRGEGSFALGHAKEYDFTLDYDFE
jgi:hypothetical protein